MVIRAPPGGERRQRRSLRDLRHTTVYRRPPTHWTPRRRPARRLAGLQDLRNQVLGTGVAEMHAEPAAGKKRWTGGLVTPPKPVTGTRVDHEIVRGLVHAGGVPVRVYAVKAEVQHDGLPGRRPSCFG